MSQPRRIGRGTALIVGVIAVAINLRPAVASVGPALDDIQASLRLSSTAASVITAAPVFCFGLLAPTGPWLSRRLGLRQAIAVLMAILVIGLTVRLGPDQVTLFAGTLVAAFAIAALNVVTPALVKLDFPERTGLVMGCYTTALTGAAAAAAGLTVPLGRHLGGGWRTGLGCWAVLALIGLAGWAPFAWRRESLVPQQPYAALRRDPMAWLVTGYFGLQSLSFYTVLSWLPTIFIDHGDSTTRAGALLSLSALTQMPVALVVPVLAARARRQSGLTLLSAILTAAGLLGILLARGSLPWLWVVILGIGQGAAFPLALMLIVQRAPEPAAVTPMSSMVQSVGYILAAFGPLLAGLLHATAGSWSPSLVLLIVLLVPQAVCGLLAGRPRQTATAYLESPTGSMARVGRRDSSRTLGSEGN